jgi:hypothetical protein
MYLFQNVIIAQTPDLTTVQLLKNSVKTCLQDQFQQTWHANIDTGSKTLNYRLFKNKYTYERPHSFNILST